MIVACALAEVACGCLAVAFLLSSPTASPGGGRGRGAPKSWDTDNLLYAAARYAATARLLASRVWLMRFQAGGAVGAVNDFLYLDWEADAEGNEGWVVQEGGTRSSGYDEFVGQQDEMAAQIVGNGGYYLDFSGNLQRLSDGSVLARFSGQRPTSLLRL